MKKNVLVFPCGTEVGLELHRSLSYDVHFDLFGASSLADHGRFVFKNYIGGLPLVWDESFIDKINDVIDDHKIDLLFPAHDQAILTLARRRGQLHCPLATSDTRVCEIACSKSATYRALADVIPVPTMNPADGRYPVFLKPDAGQGSRGCVVARSAAEFDNAIKQDPTRLVLEYLPGKEYTVDCFTDAGGKLLFVQGRERKRILNGISVNSVLSDRPEFAEYAEKINAALPFRGVWFFQLKARADGELVLLEIAPRVAGTMAMARMRGVNLPLMACWAALGHSVAVAQNRYDVEIDRALGSRFRLDCPFDAVYVDFDDCLVIDGQVNAPMAAFLYHALNANKKLVLLTRHDGDIDASLRKFRLQSLFDRVIQLNKTEQKAAFMTDKRAIFIDDSFAERQAVAGALGVPVFSPDMIAELDLSSFCAL